MALSFFAPSVVLLTLGPGLASWVEAAQPEWSTKIAGAGRFKLVLGGAVTLDKETNLVWERSPDTNGHTWVEAHTFCNNRAVGGRKGWRLPTIQELASLVDQDNPSGNPDLPPGHPFSDNMQTASYWSATTYADDPAFAWFGFLGSGDVSFNNKTLTFRVWCVRGGHGGPDAQ